MRRITILLASALLASAGTPAASPLVGALRRAGIVPGDPKLATVRPLCTVRLAGRTFTAVDIAERIRLAQSDRLYRHVVILDAQWRRTADLPYDPPARVLGCTADRLRFSAPVKIDNTLPEGTQVEVCADGRALCMVR